MNTPLDQAHTAMDASPEDDAARLRFYERLGDSELFLLLEAEPDGDQISPHVFEVEDASYILAFDREQRLAEFAEGSAPYVGLSGRALAEMLAGQNLGLGVNLGVAPSSILIPPAAVDWLHTTLSHAPAEAAEIPTEITPPKGLPDSLVTAIDMKLTTAAGLAQCAYLAGVTYASGQRSHILAFVGAEPAAETALARAANEALVFSGIEAGALDVAFFDASHPIVGALEAQALRFDLPQPIQPTERPAPGSDPSKPPKLV
ncbi:SseB family protein [Litoreibacter janthinus]|uniref:SseB protein N-terminal domain-containing protein n=1 Tax=Litoreibacter janthinus TaxID=670154 RepID=A0A1I6FSQ0_9RHOB|nr:SseB family protein [Litoreibacter janthinus]SFR32951.1 SseB protein N-terminal domain-containing protein [Litoreibacter janthinus]